MTQPNFQPEADMFSSMSDLSSLTALPLKECGTYEIGQEMSIDCCPSHHWVALLEGKIRLLERTEDGSVRTRVLLEAGDIWNRHAWEMANAIWIVAETVRLGAIPTSSLQQFPFLGVCAERSKKKIQASPEPVVELRVAPPVAAQRTTPAATASVASMSPKGSDFSSAVLPKSPPAAGLSDMINDHPGILRDILSVLRIPMDGHVSEDVPDLQSLEQKLTEHGVRCQILTLSWSQLQKLPTPWVLEDDFGGLHCVIQIKKHDIITRENGRRGTVFVDRRGNRKQWQVLAVRLSRSGDKASGGRFLEKPFTLIWYARLLLRNGFISSQMLIASLMVQVFALGMPIFYMVIFDRVFGRQNLETLDIIAIGMGLILLSDLIVRGIRSLVLTHLLIWVDRVSTDAMLDIIFKLPLTRMSRDVIRQCSEMYNDLIKANEAVVSLFLVSSLDAVFSSVVILILVNLHFGMAMVSLASLIPLTILAMITTPQVKHRAQQFIKAQRASQFCLSETLENWETLHSYNALSNAKERIRQLSNRMLGSSLWARFDTVSGSSLGGFITGVGSLVTLYYGAHEVLQGEISYGAYAAINLMSRNVISSVQKLFSSLIQFQEISGKLEKYQNVSQDIMQEAEASPVPERQRIITPSVRGQIEIRDLRFYYPADTNKNWVVGPISLTIPAGQKVIITGTSGSGKSTLIRLIQGLYHPTEGAITLDEYRLNEFDPDTRNRLIGVALQKPAFLSGTLLENLTLENPDAPMKDVLDAVRLAQLDVAIDKLPKGLDSMVAPMASNLPPTLATRLALARVFINKPSILIIDKAMDSLEPTLQAAIFSPMLQAYAQSTCVMVTDFLPVHQQADRIIVMRDGMVVEDGTFQSLIKAKGYYYHLHVVDKTFSKQ